MTGINRQPTGLLDLLQVQAGGRNPDDLAQTVRPTIDIEPFYWPDRMRSVIEPFSLSGNQLDSITIPDGEVWKVLTIAALCTLDAGAECGISFFIEQVQPQGAGGTLIAGFPELSHSNLGPARTNAAVQLPVPLILTSPQIIAIRMDYETNAAAVVGELHVLFVRIQD